MPAPTYTFGDNSAASARLRRLAEIYEPETRELLVRSASMLSGDGPRFAVDLGCGPGWSTRLLHDVLRPGRTFGLDASEAYISEARKNHGSALEFAVHDVTRAPFPVAAPDLLFCRFLLTHLQSLAGVLRTWAALAAPGALLLIHETESLETDVPELDRYYELVEELQRHYGQELFVGRSLDAALRESGWNVLESSRPRLEKPASVMAELHAANLRSWRHDEFALRSFDSREIDSLETSLGRIAADKQSGAVVINAARQIIARL